MGKKRGFASIDWRVAEGGKGRRDSSIRRSVGLIFTRRGFGSHGICRFGGRHPIRLIPSRKLSYLETSTYLYYTADTAPKIRLNPCICQNSSIGHPNQSTPCRIAQTRQSLSRNLSPWSPRLLMHQVSPHQGKSKRTAQSVDEWCAASRIINSSAAIDSNTESVFGSLR